MTRRPTKTELDKAVHAMRVYAGSGTRVRIRDAERLYARVVKAINVLVSVSGISEYSAWDQVTAEAKRLGYIIAIPGKDI